jgi:hypothetical protein
MSEQELREGLRAAAADEPALAFDPDVLLARAKQEIRRRRALFGAGTATVAVAVAAVAVPPLLASPRSDGNQAGYGWSTEPCANVPAPSPPPEPTEITATVGHGEPSALPSPSEIPTPVAGIQPSAPPTPTGEPCQLSSTEPPASPLPPKVLSSGPPIPADQLTKRAEAMRVRLADTFAKAVPGAAKIEVDKFHGEGGAITDGQVYLETSVHFTLKDVRSEVTVTVFAPGAAPTVEELCAPSTCSVRDGVDGNRLVINPDDASGADNVTQVRADGSAVCATGSGPVTVDQLTALAEDSELGL